MKIIKPIKKTTMPFEDKALVQLRQIEKLLLQETPVVKSKYAREFLRKLVGNLYNR